RLQTTAGLGNDLNRAFHGETMAGLADKVIESRARQQRHDEIRLLLSIFLKFSDVKDFDNVGMAHRGQDIALFVEQLKRSRIGDIEARFDRNFAANDVVVWART